MDDFEDDFEDDFGDDIEHISVQLFVYVDETGQENLASAIWEGERPEGKPEGWVRWIGDTHEVTLSRGRDDNDTLQ